MKMLTYNRKNGRMWQIPRPHRPPSGHTTATGVWHDTTLQCLFLAAHFTCVGVCCVLYKDDTLGTYIIVGPSRESLYLNLSSRATFSDSEKRLQEFSRKRFTSELSRFVLCCGANTTQVKILKAKRPSFQLYPFGLIHLYLYMYLYLSLHLYLYLCLYLSENIAIESCVNYRCGLILAIGNYDHCSQPADHCHRPPGSAQPCSTLHSCANIVPMEHCNARPCYTHSSGGSVIICAREN